VTSSYTGKFLPRRDKHYFRFNTDAFTVERLAPSLDTCKKHRFEGCMHG